LIGRKVLRDQGKALFKLLDEVDETAVALADVFPAMESSLQGASRQLRQVTTFVLSRAGEQEHLASAVAYNYLMGTGTIIAGWLMAKSALIATSLRNEGGFYEAKISTAGFYFEQIMPRAQAHLSGVSAAATLTMDFPVEEF
jgi:3-(methylthio)propanoyl-CoA dehydrogenase